MRMTPERLITLSMHNHANARLRHCKIRPSSVRFKTVKWDELAKSKPRFASVYR